MPSAGNEGGRAWETCALRIMSEFVYIRSHKSQSSEHCVGGFHGIFAGMEATLTHNTGALVKLQSVILASCSA